KSGSHSRRIALALSAAIRLLTVTASKTGRRPGESLQVLPATAPPGRAGRRRPLAATAAGLGSRRALEPAAEPDAGRPERRENGAQDVHDRHDDAGGDHEDLERAAADQGGGQRRPGEDGERDREPGR